jgi:hypothetical protein
MGAAPAPKRGGSPKDLRGPGLDVAHICLSANPKIVGGKGGRCFARTTRAHGKKNDTKK